MAQYVYALFKTRQITPFKSFSKFNKVDGDQKS